MMKLESRARRTVFAIGGFLLVLYGFALWLDWPSPIARGLWWLPWWVCAVGVGELWHSFKPEHGRARVRVMVWGAAVLALLLIWSTGTGWSG